MELPGSRWRCSGRCGCSSSRRRGSSRRARWRRPSRRAQHWRPRSRRSLLTCSWWRRQTASPAGAGDAGDGRAGRNALGQDPEADITRREVGVGRADGRASLDQDAVRAGVAPPGEIPGRRRSGDRGVTLHHAGADGHDAGEQREAGPAQSGHTPSPGHSGRPCTLDLVGPSPDDRGLRAP